MSIRNNISARSVIYVHNTFGLIQFFYSGDHKDSIESASSAMHLGDFSDASSFGSDARGRCVYRPGIGSAYTFAPIANGSNNGRRLDPYSDNACRDPCSLFHYLAGAADRHGFVCGAGGEYRDPDQRHAAAGGDCHLDPGPLTLVRNLPTPLRDGVAAEPHSLRRDTGMEKALSLRRGGFSGPDGAAAFARRDCWCRLFAVPLSPLMRMASPAGLEPATHSLGISEEAPPRAAAPRQKPQFSLPFATTPPI